MFLQLREERKQELEEHVNAVNAILKEVSAVGAGLDSDEEGEVWGGIEEEEPAEIPRSPQFALLHARRCQQAAHDDNNRHRVGQQQSEPAGTRQEELQPAQPLCAKIEQDQHRQDAQGQHQRPQENAGRLQ